MGKSIEISWKFAEKLVASLGYCRRNWTPKYCSQLKTANTACIQIYELNKSTNIIFNDFSYFLERPCDKQPCGNYKKCIDLANGNYKCICLPNWTGPKCEKGTDQVYLRHWFFLTLNSPKFNNFFTEILISTVKKNLRAHMSVFQLGKWSAIGFLSRGRT